MKLSTKQDKPLRVNQIIDSIDIDGKGQIVAVGYDIEWEE